MTRIVAGRLGGRRLAVPSGRDTRPTSDRVREALFSALGSRLDLAGCRFADLYAGSGAVGLEACSRGAAHVLLVESDPAAARVIRRNVADLAVGAAVTLRTTAVEQVTGQPPEAPYDVVFADPPYAVPTETVGTVLDNLVRHRWLAPDATVVVERSSRTGEPPWPAGLVPDRPRRYGESTLWYAEHPGG